jgi:hypothetical protein
VPAHVDLDVDDAQVTELESDQSRDDLGAKRASFDRDGDLQRSAAALPKCQRSERPLERELDVGNLRFVVTQLDTLRESAALEREEGTTLAKEQSETEDVSD